MILKSRHLYYEVCKLSKNFSERNARKISVVFLHWLLCDVIKSQNDHARMRINGPLASLPRLRARRIVCPVLPQSYFWQYCDPFLDMKI